MSIRTTARRRAQTLGICAVLVALCAGCMQFPAPESPPPIAFAERPVPPGVETEVAREPAPSAENCDAIQSLRPPDTMPVPGKMAPTTTMGQIFGRGRLIVGLDIGSNLFSFRDPISGDIQGFDVDIARAIATAIFGRPDRIEYNVLSSAERVQALEDRTVDIVVKTMSITCSRGDSVAYSSPYYIASQRIMALRDSTIKGPEDLAGKRVCAARGSTSIGRIQSIAPRANLVTTTTWADCLVLMQQAQAEAVSTDDAILAGLAEQDPWVQVVGPSLGSEYYGVGIPKGQDDMVRFVNGVLARVRASGQWQEIYNRWLTILGPGSGPPQPVYRD